MKAYLSMTAILVTVSSSALAMSEEEFQIRAAKLRSNQQGTDTTIGRLSGSLGFSPLVSTSASHEEKMRPLFVVHAELSPAKISAGKLLYGKVLNRLIVGPDGSPALIILDDQQGPLSSVRMMGMARQSGTSGRLTFELTKILTRPGRTVPVQATALDAAGAYGLEAQVFSGKALALGGAMASSFVSGLASAQQTQTINALGFGAPQTTGRNALLQGLAQTAADQSKRLIDEATAEKPVLVVEAETPIVVLVQEEVRF